MNRKFEETLFYFASCTLKGIKPGSIFSCLKKDYYDIYKVVSYYENILASFNIKIDILKDTDKYILVYLYRENHLDIIWKQKKCQSFMKKCGYCDCIEESINILKNKLQGESFPHDIGIFLGYCIDDVISFIENEGKNYECIGYWKVYSNMEEKKKLFSMFDKCTNSYLNQFHSGYSLQQLIN